MKITKVEAIPITLQLKEPIIWATGALYQLDHLLIRIETSDGVEGYSEGVPRPTIYGETQKSIYEMINNVLGPKLIGLDPFDIEKIWDKMELVIWNPAAKGAIDVAIYDIIGKKLGIPVYKYLGGWSNKVTLAWCIGLKSAEEMIKEMENVVKLGIKTFKVKGGIDHKEDIGNVKEIHKNFNNEIDFYLDANQGYDFKRAYEVISETEEYISCIEEPLPVWDANGRKKLSESVSLPILIDESAVTVDDVNTNLKQGIAGQVLIKIPRTGFTKSRKIVNLCETYNIKAKIGMQAEGSLGTVAGTHFGAAFKQTSLPSEQSFYLTAKDSIINEEINLEDGCIVLSDKPGLGVTIDWEKVKKCKSF